MVLVLVAGLMLHGLGLAVFNVHSLSVRAALIPPDMLGRATATYRMISNGTLPLNGLLAALLGSVFGIRGAMAIAIGLLSVCCAVFVCSHVRRFDTGQAVGQAVG